MRFDHLTAQTISSWEREVGPTPVHGVELELMLGGTVERHRHSRGQIMMAATGVATVSVASRWWVIGGARAIWVPEGVQHAITASTAAELRNLQVSRPLAPHLPAQTCLVAVSPLFRELLTDAVGGPNAVAPGSRAAKILDLLLMEFSPIKALSLFLPEPTDIRLQRICNKLRADPADDRTLAKWADTAGGCTRTLERLFQKETGLTFAQWRRQLRLHAALVRLNRGESVTSVALDTGYRNTSAFIEMFRRLVGCTPGRYLDS
jgi:AraC-like DNA-binding protein/quercetin dioxygenase-like cupin family protein